MAHLNGNFKFSKKNDLRLFFLTFKLLLITSWYLLIKYLTFSNVYCLLECSLPNLKSISIVKEETSLGFSVRCIFLLPNILLYFS